MKEAMGERLLKNLSEVFFEILLELIRALSQKHGLNERSELSLFDARIGVRVTNSRYRTEANVSEYVASRDLKKLSDLELLNPLGDGRGRAYEAGDELKLIRLKTRSIRRADDPYALAEKKASELASRAAGAQLSLPLTGPSKEPSAS